MLIPQVFLVNKEWKMMLQVSNLSGLVATTLKVQNSAHVA